MRRPFRANRRTCASLGAIITGLALSQPQLFAQSADRTEFITLGTACGPIPNPKRAQPANLLRSGSLLILVDVGDGTAEQLGKIGVPLGAIRTVFISHLHFDHIGGLFGLLSLRFQMITPSAVTIYGPVGIKAVVDGLLTAMEPALARPGRAQDPISLRDSARVIEITDGWKDTLGPVAVTAAVNTHYVLTPPSAALERERTLGFRFDAPDKSIVYTGDTGPSPAMERLGQNADVLITEVIDPDGQLQEIKTARPDMPASGLAYLQAHFHKQHLSPAEAGLMAQRAQAKSLVLTHNCIADDHLDAARAEVATTYAGPVSFAQDFQRF